MKKIIALCILVSAMSLPTAAFAGCGGGSVGFHKSCEAGVKVYRGQINDLTTVGPSAAQANLQIAKMSQDTARRRIAADRATAQGKASLRAQQLANERHFYRRATRHPSRFFSGRTHDRNSLYGRYTRLGYPGHNLTPHR